MRIDDEYVLINYENYDDNVNNYSISFTEIDRLCNEIDILTEYLDENKQVKIMNNNRVYPEEYLNNTDRRIQVYNNSYYIYFYLIITMCNLINIINLLNIITSIKYIQLIPLNSNTLADMSINNKINEIDF